MSLFEDVLMSARESSQTFNYKLKNCSLSIKDEKEALTNPEWAYWFAYDIPEANIEKCQDAACKDPQYAYKFIKYASGRKINILPKKYKITKQYTYQ